MKFRVPDIVLGALLTVAVFATGMMLESSRRPPTEQRAASNTAKENASHQPERSLWNWLTHDAAGFFTLWLVIVGAGQIGLFYWQLRLIRVAADDAKRAGEAAERAAKATEAAVELSRETAQRQLRAYVNVINCQLDQFGFDQPPVVTVGLKNTGQTPAYRLRDKTEVYVAAFPFNASELIEVGELAGILGPAAEVDLGPLPLSGVLSAETTEQIIKGQMAIYVRGIVKYFDAFGQERTTKFHMYFRGPISRKLLRFKQADTHNEAD